MLKICFAFRTVKHFTSTQLKLDNVPLKSSYTRLHGGMHPCKEPLRLSPLFSTLPEPGCPQQLPCHQSNEAPHSPCFNPDQKMSEGGISKLPSLLLFDSSASSPSCSTPHIVPSRCLQPRYFYGCQMKLEHKNHGLWPDVVPWSSTGHFVQSSQATT